MLTKSQEKTNGKPKAKATGEVLGKPRAYSQTF